MNPLMPYLIATAMVAVSLGVAYVLFRFLKSTAIVKGTKWQAGGALAGFLLVLWFFQSVASQIAAQITRETCTTVDWTVTGYVFERGVGPFPGIQVSQETIPPLYRVDTDGRFVLERASVLRTAKDPYPRLHFVGDSTHDPIVDYRITRETAEIDEASATIKLTERLELQLHQQTQVSGGGQER